MTLERRYPTTIAAPVDHELVVTKSRFLAHAAPVTSPAEAEAVIARIKKSAWDARHHCVAMVTGLLGDQARSSDDGEPSGTAGVPMLDVLRRRDLTDVVVVVTRYFGGVKLGAGGLVRAYSTATSEALDLAAPVRRVSLTQLALSVPHAEAGRFDNLLRDWAGHHDAVLGEPQYAAEATLTLWVPPGHADALRHEVAAASAGTVQVITGPDRIVDVPG